MYRSTHIDTDRDVNSFGDFPWDANAPLLIHNSELTRYLRQNVEEFQLDEKIKFGTRVTMVTPLGEPGDNKWEVTYSDSEGGSTTEVFDCVLVCTGRHGGGGYIPQLENQDK